MSALDVGEEKGGKQQEFHPGVHLSSPRYIFEKEMCSRKINGVFQQIKRMRAQSSMTLVLDFSYSKLGLEKI